MSKTKIERVVWAGLVTERLRPVVRGIEARGCQVEFLFSEGMTCADALAEERLDACLDGLLARVDCADMVILAMNDSGVLESGTILDPLNDVLITQIYRNECLFLLKILNRLMPLLERGTGKRIAVLTNRQDSHACCGDVSNYGHHMAAAALRLALRQLFNELHPDGYTFRLYCQDPQGNDAYAAEYFLRNRSWEREDPQHSDENRFVIHDANGFEVPW